MEIIIKCSDDNRGSKNVFGEPIQELVRCEDCKYQSKGENESESWNLCGYRPWQYTPTSDDHLWLRKEERRMSDDLISRQKAIDAVYDAFCYAYCDNCEKEMNEDLCGDCHRKYQNWSASKKIIEKVINNLPSAQQKPLKYSGDSICVYCMTGDCAGCVYEPMEGVMNE